MNNELKQLLTIEIKEIWHEYTIGYETGGLSKCSCGNTGCAVLDICANENREFNKPEDWEIVRQKIVLPNIELFQSFVWNEFLCLKINKNIYDVRDVDSIRIISWLFLKTPEELCEIAVSFLKHRKIYKFK